MNWIIIILFSLSIGMVLYNFALAGIISANKKEIQRLKDNIEVVESFLHQSKNDHYKLRRVMYYVYRCSGVTDKLSYDDWLKQQIKTSEAISKL